MLKDPLISVCVCVWGWGVGPLVVRGGSWDGQVQCCGDSVWRPTGNANPGRSRG